FRGDMSCCLYGGVLYSAYPKRAFAFCNFGSKSLAGVLALCGVSTYFSATNEAACETDGFSK
ncbi:MAG: hypothetical protein IJ364_05885, partial [Oscillospiraceae bacterium]|nr:hypothetical protein [Oscillospiraceae bacterium]